MEIVRMRVFDWRRFSARLSTTSPVIVGRRRTDIVRQFVMETTLIAVAGGTVGLLVGASLSRAIATFAGWSTIISSGSLTLAFSVSVLIGLVSGVYPAMKASRLDPVEALHYE